MTLNNLFIHFIVGKVLIFCCTAALRHAIHSFTFQIITICIPTAVPPTPVLAQPNCSARECVLEVQQSMATRHLEVEYGTDARRWSSNQESVRKANGTDCFGDVAIDYIKFLSGLLKCSDAEVKCKRDRYECEVGFPKASRE